MKTLLLLLPLIGLAIGAGDASRFAYVDVMLDSKGQPLAAWQLEFAAEVGKVSLVGVEQGDHPAYGAHPAYYDPAALSQSRILLADYSLNADLPTKKFRAARLMLEIRGEVKPQYVTKLIAAADADGKTIGAEISLVESR